MMEVKSEYKMTVFDEIPNDWVTKTLESISKKIVGGGTPSRKEKRFYVGDIPWVTVKDMQGDFYQGNSEEYINEEAIKMSASNLIEPDNIIIATRISLGKGFINTKSIAINQDLKAIYLKNNEISNSYFLYWYLSNAEYIKSLGSGTTVKGIRLEQLIKIKLPIPSLKEQQKIVKILSTVDERIEQTDQLIEKTKELKKGLMQQLLTKGIGHNEFKQTKLGEIPVNWSMKNLGDIVSLKNGFAFDSKYYKSEGEWILLTPGNFKSEGGIKFKGNKEKYYEGPISSQFILKFNDLLIVLTDLTQSCKILGAPAFVTENNKFLHNQRLGKVNYLNDSIILPSYLFYYFNCSFYRKNVKSTATGTTVNHTSTSKILNIEIALPPYYEQQKIADILSSVDEDIETYVQEKSKYEELKKGLMQQLLTGKTRVKVD